MISCLSLTSYLDTQDRVRISVHLPETGTSEKSLRRGSAWPARLLSISAEYGSNKISPVHARAQDVALVAALLASTSATARLDLRSGLAEPVFVTKPERVEERSRNDGHAT